MRKIGFNDNWFFYPANEPEKRVGITLPHDAMREEKRTMDSPGGTNTGWYECNDYVYEKDFTLDHAYSEKYACLEFEGVYRSAEVYINDQKAAFRPYGYTNFYVNVSPFLNPNGKNHVKVKAYNADQPNSRWYSGAGIYRPVSLWLSEKQHILLNGVKIKTLSHDPAVVEVSVRTTGAGKVKIDIYDGNETVYSNDASTEGEITFKAKIENAKLWSPENPYLYKCKVSYADDEAEEAFGIRTISCTREKGFCINGKRIILRGCCIHHDNGLLGACAYPDAEERKIRILQSAGYNAVRSAHNPCSKAMLDACDRLGMLMMDEYVDMWYIHKTMYDYASYCPEWYEEDIKDMIDKDFNHPSVVLYSLGNEVGESASSEGVAFFTKMKNVCDAFDPTRPVTCGINILFNYMCSLGMGIYSDEKAKKNPQKQVGSAFFNNLAGIFGNYTMKIGAKLHGCDVKTRDVFAAMDVAGYNYGILRYKRDLKKYPDRIIVGSETFCEDAYKFYELAKEEPGLIGDFVWAGMDYLGEVGIGSWEYGDYAKSFNHGAGWISAGSGRVDITGKLTGEALYTRAAFELEEKPLIAVVPVNHTGDSHSPSAWKFTNALPSWSWNGLNENRAKVEVYSKSDYVELLINGKSVAKKKQRNDCRFVFNTVYQDGEITAVAYDTNGKETGRSSLKTAGKETKLSIEPEKHKVKPGQLCYIRLKYTDEEGTVKPLARGRIDVTIQGGKLVALGHACPYNEDGYLNDWTDTYFGEALAVVLAEGDVVLKASSHYGSAEVKVGCE